MDLLALSDFNLVARHGGFGKASRASGRPKATLSRRVAELEVALDLRLFERGTRVLKLTEEGRALFERTAPLLTELEETTRALTSGGQTPRGRLRISAPLLFSQTAIGKLAAGFVLRFPEVRLEILTDDRPVDMVEEAFDLVIRVNPAPDNALVGRIFLRDRLVVVARPDVARPPPGEPLRAVIRGALAATETWTLQGETLTATPVVSLSSYVMVRDAVRLGVGAARLPLSLAGPDIASGRLVLWGQIQGPDIALWALYPSRRLLNSRVAAFLEFLKEAFPNGSPEELAACLDA
ncbi:MAG: LysR family transcriptional regulator [Candidatus Saccharibacteria bacterium]|nr:LysR family transcriptional regulator [Pseudorhodobacter sp.]